MIHGTCAASRRKEQNWLTLLGMAALAVLLAGCQGRDEGKSGPAKLSPEAESINALADQLLEHMRATNAYVRLQSKLPITDLGSITFERAKEEAKFAEKMLSSLDNIPLRKIPHEQVLLAKMLRKTFVTNSYADENYWFDFAITPYAGVSGIINQDQQILAAQPLASAAERENYLKLLEGHATRLEQAAAKTRAQADKNIFLPKPSIPGVIATMRGLRASAPKTLLPDEARLTGVSAEDAKEFTSAVQQRITSRVAPAYEQIVAVFDDWYRTNAPAEVGLSRYRGGKERYLRLITDYTGLDLTPQEIQETGKKGIAELEQRMQEIREQLGFKGTREEFHEKLRKDPRFLAKSPAEVEQRYMSYMERIEPLMPKYFAVLPKAPFGVRRLAPAAEKGMTYGYYDQPSPAEPKGFYNYNGSDLQKRSLVTAEHLIFHELLPGHHLQLSLQLENTSAHPVRKFLDYTAFVEGWAEYAASLGEEMGLYSDLYDLYGHLLMQAFLTARLVVDTGLNFFNMPLEEARAYMKEHTFESDVQIASETLRYSTDIYAQALGYRLGYEKFWELRRKAEQALGDRFDIREFHAAAIGQGSMPLDVLEEHIDWYIGQHQ